MRWHVVGGLGLGAALAGMLTATPPAVAQTATAPSPTAKAPPSDTAVSSVTVTRPRQKAMNAYIDDIAQPSQHGELATWTAPVCIRIGGLEPLQSLYVKERILDTATKLGLRRAPGKCAPNMLVVFSPDPSGLAREIRRKAELMFDDVDLVGHIWPPDRNRLDAFFNSAQPVRWWMQAQPFSSDDPGAGPDASSGSAGSGNQFAGEVHLFNPMRGARHLRDSFSFVLVIVDAKQAKGLPMEAIGSYVSMVTLARFKTAPDVGDAPSVLSLFADHTAGKPYYRDLTKRDWAFLYSLYATRDMGDYNEQRAEMGHKMERIMVGKDPRAVGAESENAAPDPAP
jgi:hypothetical protein